MQYEAQIPSKEDADILENLLNGAQEAIHSMGFEGPVGPDIKIRELALDSLTFQSMIQSVREKLSTCEIDFTDHNLMDGSFQDALDNDWSLMRLSKRLKEQLDYDRRITKLTSERVLRKF